MPSARSEASVQGNEYRSGDYPGLCLEPQSSAPTPATFNVGIATPSAETTSQNVSFTDMNPAFDYRVISEVDPTRRIADMEDAPLGDFLSRPILIHEVSWAPNTPLFTVFDPWSLFFENPKNINRIVNFNLLRSKLCVKMVVNGNSFYYGRAIASYNPRPLDDEISHPNVTFTPVHIIGASQRPHVYLNPTECQGGTLCLPFLAPENSLSIPEQQWGEMGRCRIDQLTPLKQANGATEAITISVFAWAEDVQLSIPTAAQPYPLAPQSDEYGTGPISKPASIIARVAGKLTDAPIIGPFALATTMAASVAGKVAHLFGFSRPAILDDCKPFRPNIMGNLANVNMPDSTVKLSLDTKQETTVDSRVAGLGPADEMSLKSIVTRESYYCSFPWAIGTTPGTRLFSTFVSPSMYQSNLTIAGNDEFHLTPSAFAALPFKYWGGSMIYRLQFVTSNFHRGRIRIVWDPVDGHGVSYNTMYTKVIDIADTRELTMSVGWGQKTSFLEVDSPFTLWDDSLGVPRPEPMFHAGPEPIPQPLVSINGRPGANGVLSVFVVNDLTVPTNATVANNDIVVNVFSAMGDDFRFGNPDIRQIEGITLWPPEVPALNPQSDVDPNPVQDSEPIMADVQHEVAAFQPEADETMHVFMGEEITSVRQLLKRYMLHTSYTPGPVTASYLETQIVEPDFPYYRGYNPNGPYLAANGARFSYSLNTWLNYFTPAYVGYRGGLRRKFLYYPSTYMASTQGTLGAISKMTVSRVVDNIDVDNYSPTQVYTPFVNQSVIGTCRGSNPSETAYLANVGARTADGAAVTSTAQNSALEVEFPYYSNKRFYSARQIDTLRPRSYPELMPGLHEITQSTAQGVIDSYVSTAEDFTLLMFIGVPPMYLMGGGSANPVPIPPPTP